MSSIRVKDEMIDDILNKVNASSIGLSIPTYLKEEFGINSEAHTGAYINRMVNEGYITLHVFGKLPVTFARITEKGKKFIIEGGHTAQKINSMVDSILKKSSHITTNNNKIELAIGELCTIEKELKSLKNIYGSELNRYANNLKVVISKVFLPGHEIYKTVKIGPPSKDEILEECTNAINHLQFEQLESHSDLSNLHHAIRTVSEAQFNNGHFREAVYNSFMKLVEVIKEAHPITDSKGKLKDGVDLMQDVFSKENPKISFSSDANERQGMMFLYSGAIAGIRNKYGHKTKEIDDKFYAYELIHFASALMRLFEDKTIY